MSQDSSRLDCDTIRREEQVQYVREGSKPPLRICEMWMTTPLVEGGRSMLLEWRQGCRTNVYQGADGKDTDGTFVFRGDCGDIGRYAHYELL